MSSDPSIINLLSEFPPTVGDLGDRHRRRAIVATSSRGTLPVVQVPLETVREAAAILANPAAVERDFASDASITGTAFLVHPIGLFLTAAHVIKRWIDAAASGNRSEDSPTKLLYVKSIEDRPPGRAFLELATVICADFIADEPADMAVLFAPHSQQLSLPPLKLSSLPPAEGDRVMALGHPYGMHLLRNGTEEGYGGPFVTEGVVSKILPSSAFPPERQHLFAFDGVIRKGMSGGPVIDSYTGLVVGVTIENYPHPSVILPGSFGLAVPTRRFNGLLNDMFERLKSRGIISEQGPAAP